MSNNINNEDIIFTEETTWGSNRYQIDYLEVIDFSGFSPITQVQALCFNEPGSLTIYKDTKGCYGLPGGTVEEGESLEAALRREIKEEVAAELRTYGPLLLLRVTDVSTKTINYQARYWATVSLLLQPVDDPAKKAITRHSVNVANLPDYLKWGKKVDLYLNRCRLTAPDLFLTPLIDRVAKQC